MEEGARVLPALLSDNFRNTLKRITCELKLTRSQFFSESVALHCLTVL